MIFHETWEQVLDGSKTQTRRLVKDGDYFSSREKPYADTAYVLGNKRMRFSEGRTYAVQPGRGKKSLGRIAIIAIRRERLHDMNCKDFIAEGMTTYLRERDAGVHLRTQFIYLWDSIHPKGKRWTDNPEVWVLEFELMKERENGKQESL